MESFTSLGSFSNFDWNSMLKTNDITPQVQKHLVNVYTLLLACCVSATAGSILFLFYGIGNPLLTFLGALATSLLLYTDADKSLRPYRVGLLCGFGFFNGLSLGPLLAIANFVDTTLVTTTLIGTVTVFACFSLSAMVAKRRSYLYLGGTLSSALSLMLVLSILNWFMRSEFLYLLHLYAGLLVFSAFIIFDTQLIIERASLGSRDAAQHACDLFIDLVGIFVRLLVILIRNAEKKNKKRRN